MEHITRTLRLSALQSSMVRGAPYAWVPYTTLNEKFGVQSRVYPGSGAYPVLSYLAIGRGGLNMEVGADGEVEPWIGQHKATDAALFEHMPFSLRQLNDDLPPTRRARYALRQQVEFHGTVYWAYWLKRIDFTNADTELFHKQVLADQSITVEPYIYDQSNLSPEPMDLTDSGTNLLAGHSVIASTIIGMTLDEFDIQEIRNASDIIKRKTGRAIVSEIAICTGARKQINAPSQTGTFVFEEAIGVEIAAFIKALYPLDYINKQFTDNLELGISEPLFRVEGINP